jgi:hypothetical protein
VLQGGAVGLRWKAFACGKGKGDWTLRHTAGAAHHVTQSSRWSKFLNLESSSVDICDPTARKYPLTKESDCASDIKLATTLSTLGV